MKLITELNETVSYVTEAKEDGHKDHFIEGIFLQSNVVNRNGREYPKNIMEKEVSRYMAEVVKLNRAYGELGHPAGPQINLDRVSHIITELKWDGDNVIGKAKITRTPMGDIARGLLESGAQLGVSSRGMGSLKESNGKMVVQSDYKIATAADIVADPSAPNAFVRGIMENVDWIYDPVKGTWQEQRLDEIKNDIKRMSLSEINNNKLTIFEDYIASLAIRNR
jgi:hypothetical protein